MLSGDAKWKVMRKLERRIFMNQLQAAHTLVNFAIQFGGYMEMDRPYLLNQIAKITGNTWDVSQNVDTLDQPLSEVIDSLANNDKMIQKTLYDFVTPPTSVVNALFAQQYHKNQAEAMNYFYELSCQTKSIQTDVDVQSVGMLMYHRVGNLKQALPSHPSFYDEGSYLWPARRYIRMNVEGESFGFTYAPYPQWQRHGLLMAEQEPQASIAHHLPVLASIFETYWIAHHPEQIRESVPYQLGQADLPIKHSKVIGERASEDVTYQVLDTLLPSLKIMTTKAKALEKALQYFDDEWVMIVEKVEENYSAYVIKLPNRQWSIAESVGVAVGTKDDAEKAVSQLIDKMKKETTYSNLEERLAWWQALGE